MMGFTDDPEPHRAAILARRPSPDDDPEGGGPPITDDRPLGEREDVVIDVVQVRFSEADVRAVRDRVNKAVSGKEWQDFGLDGTGYDIHRQRVVLYLVNPREGALEELGDRLPDPSAVCVEVTRTPQPPSGPLDVIPDLDVEDPLVSCPGTPAVRYSQMIDPPSIDEVDHPAVDVLRGELDTPGGETLPRGRWVVISIDDDRATFAALAEGGFGVAGVERQGDKWIFAGEASGRPCEPAVPLPAGLASVEVRLDLDSMPGADDTAIDLLVTEWGCAGGREMGDALRGPQVIETDDAVLVAFAVVPVAGMATCPDNPSTSVTIELSDPLGQRWVYDGLHFPPKPLTAVADPPTSAEYRDSFPCRAGSAFAARNRPDTEGPDTFETANGALLAPQLRCSILGNLAGRCRVGSRDLATKEEIPPSVPGGAGGAVALGLVQRDRDLVALVCVELQLDATQFAGSRLDSPHQCPTDAESTVLITHIHVLDPADVALQPR